MLVIVNPYATTVSDRLRDIVLRSLSSRYEVASVSTERRDHATEIAREATREDFDVVVAFGGDGTANEAANGLIGSDLPLTCLPGGSTNVLCRMLGIPGDAIDAAEHLLGMADRFAPRRVDLGRVGDRCFTFSSGIGLDASVVARIDASPALKARFGAWYAAYAGLTAFAGDYVRRPPRLDVEIDGRPGPSGVTILVQNGDPYTYFNTRPLHVADGAGLTSGTLAGAVLSSARPTVAPGVAWRLLSSHARVIDHRAVEQFSDASEVVVRVDRPMPLHVDGDHIGDVTDARFGVLPAALSVVS